MATDDTAFPRFYRSKEENGFKSSQAGHPVFDDVEMVEIIIPGQTQSISHVRVKQAQRDRWPQQYAAFKAGLEPALEGSPLEEWPPLSPAQVANLKALQIHTVEQLATASDTVLEKIGMGSRALRDKAAAWLDNANGGEALSKALAHNERLTAELADMQRKHNDLAQTVQRLADAQNLGTGVAAAVA